MSSVPDYQGISSLEAFIALREGQHLEFKGKAAVDDPRILPRAVCALLNSEGGTVVVGVAEERGLPRLDPILGDFDETRTKIRDRLIDTIDPRHPNDLELRKLSCVRGFGLAIDVPRSPELHAVREKGALAFYGRVADRVVQLGMREIRARLTGSTAADQTSDREARVRGELATWKKLAMQEAGRAPDYSGGLFVFLHGACEPIGWKVALDRLRPSVLDPTPLGIRRNGFHYASGHAPTPSRSSTEREWLVAGDIPSMYRRVEWSTDGRLRFATTLVPEILRPSRTEGDMYPGPFDTPGGYPDWEPHPSGFSYRPLWPKPLIETISSCCRLHAELLSEQELLEAEIHGALVLTDVESTMLGKEWIGDEDRVPIASTHEHVYRYDETPPLESLLEREEYLSSPDRLAHKLVALLYREYGLTTADVPFFRQDVGQFQF